MKKIYSKKKIIDTITNCAKDYKNNFENKKILFIVANKNQKLSAFEVAMFPINFHHLTGVDVIENGNKINSYRFYQRFLNNEVKTKNVQIKDNTSYLKLEILPQLMNLDKTVKMIGQYDNSRIYL